MNLQLPTRLVLTQAMPQAQAWHSRLQQLSQGLLSTILFPLFTLEPVQDCQPLDAALRHLQRFSLVVFLSPNAIRFSAAALGRLGLNWPSTLPVAVVGPGSAATLTDHGLVVPEPWLIQPPAHGRHDAQILITTLKNCTLWSTFYARPVLVLRARQGRPYLENELRAAGLDVEAVSAYEHLPRWISSTEQVLLHRLCQPGVTWLLTSSQALRHWYALMQRYAQPGTFSLDSVPLLVTQQRIFELAQHLGAQCVRQIPPDPEAAWQALRPQIELPDGDNTTQV